MVWEAFKRFGCQDKKRWGGGSHTSFDIPSSLCSVILPRSIVALLTASRFSKGRSISSSSVPRLRLILFWTFVVARELIKEHLIAITCCQCMMVNGVTIFELTIDPCTHIGRSKMPLFPSGSWCWCQPLILTVALWGSRSTRGCEVSMSTHFLPRGWKCAFVWIWQGWPFFFFPLLCTRLASKKPQFLKTPLKCQVCHWQNWQFEWIPAFDHSSAAHQIMPCVS